MKCQNCGKEMIKIGTLTETEINDFFFVNEKFATVNQALESQIINDLEFTEGQVFEYFRACYDQLAQARYLQFMFERNLKKRLETEKNIIIDDVSFDVFVHPEE